MGSKKKIVCVRMSVGMVQEIRDEITLTTGKMCFSPKTAGQFIRQAVERELDRLDAERQERLQKTIDCDDCGQAVAKSKCWRWVDLITGDPETLCVTCYTRKNTRNSPSIV